MEGMARLNIKTFFPVAHLTSEQIAFLRTELDFQLRKVTEATVHTRRLCEQVGLDADMGLIIRANATRHQRQSETHLRRLAAMLTGLSAATREMEEGRFGMCERCQQPLPYELLRTNLVSRCCDSCAAEKPPTKPTLSHAG